MHERMDIEALEGARLAFALASRLICLEPQEDDIRMYVSDRLFDDAPFGADNENVGKGLGLLDSWCCSVDDVARATEDLQREWLMLFVGCGTPKAPCWESFYTEPNGLLYGQSTLEVRSWYRRYGLRVEKANNEPDDNLGLMLSFVGQLIELERAALAKPDFEAATEVRDAQKEFIATQVLPWIPAWRYQAAKYARSDFYRGVASLVFGLVEEYACRFGIEFVADRNAFVERRSEEAAKADTADQDA